MLKIQSGVFSLVIISIIVSCAQSQCNISEPYQECAALYKIFQNTLFNSTSNDNLFLLQSIFYPSTRITPVLVKVAYKLNMNSFESLQSTACPSSKSSVCFRDESYTFGWTSREIYRIFHPAIINQLRFQLPFWLLQISESIHFLTDDYDLEALLWDGAQNLPSVNLTLDVDLTNYNFACHPTVQQIEEALGELNQWVS